MPVLTDLAFRHFMCSKIVTKYECLKQTRNVTRLKKSFKKIFTFIGFLKMGVLFMSRR